MTSDGFSGNTAKDTGSAIQSTMQLIGRLRGRNGCPWDRKQTPRSMVRYLAEEIYELVDAIESDQSEDICEELGDVLFLVLFILDIFADRGRFDLKRVVDVNVEKMVRRHPHVFGSESVDHPDGVKRRWQEIKKQEKETSGHTSALDSVPRSLPALMRAYKISDRAAKTGFDWRTLAGVADKVNEEWAELQAAIELGDPNRTDIEFGDLMFTLVNLARFAKIHPETALNGANRKFDHRFRRLESIVASQGQQIATLTDDRLDEIWESVKREETSQ